MPACRADRNNPGYTVTVANRQRRLKLNARGIEELTGWVLRREGVGGAEVSFLFLNNERIRELNRRYLDRDYPTDVLSFPQNEGRSAKLHPWFLGDVVISTEKVVEQSARLRQRVEDEFSLCLIHGLLHLLGYRDHPARSRRLMREREEELLRVWKRRKKCSVTRS